MTEAEWLVANKVTSPAKLAIRAGDFIRFTSAGESLVTRVIRTTRYPDFPALNAEEDPGAINPRTDRAGLLQILRELYSPQRERLGALAIEIRRVSHEAAAVRARTKEPC